MRTLTAKEVKYIDKALTHHIDYIYTYGGTPCSLKGVPMVARSPISSSDYLRVMDYISINNKGSMSEKVSATLANYFDIVGVKNLKEALQRLISNNKKEISTCK